MTPLLCSFFTCFSAFFHSRCSLSLESIALRQQLGVLKRKNPLPRLRFQDRIFWILLRRLWPAWKNVLVIVKPETVIFPPGVIRDQVGVCHICPASNWPPSTTGRPSRCLEYLQPFNVGSIFAELVATHLWRRTGAKNRFYFMSGRSFWSKKEKS